jgi:predicted acetyltransferase
MLTDVRERGELLAILYASESIIYGRFGFGLSTLNTVYDIDPHYGALAHDIDTPGTVAILHAEEARSVIPPVYDRYRRLQPAEIRRSDTYWNMWLADYPDWREGMSARVYATYENAAGSIDGFVAYRLDGKWENGFPNGRLEAGVLAAMTDEARFGLWKFLLGQDLVRQVTVRGTVHEPVRYMLADPRRLRVKYLTDGLWTRVVDVPHALEARRYATDDAFVLGIEDPFMPENTGRYRLEGSPQGATCRRTDESADLCLNIADLGAVFQGGIPLTALSRAGRIQEEKDGAARRAEAFFASHPEPVCMTHF